MILIIISFQIAFTIVLSLTVILSPTDFFFVPTIQPSNFLFSGAVKPLSGRVYSLPLVTDAFSMLPPPPAPSKVMSTVLPFHVAVRVTFPVIVILSLACFTPSLSPTFQPANTLSFGAVKVGVGSSYSLPFVTVLSSIEPDAPSPALKSTLNSTLNSMGFQMALISVSPVIVISVSGCLRLVSSPIFHPENS